MFSKNNPPPGYYHYLYLREDGTPYYSGKGKGRRAWEAEYHVIKPPKDQSRIIITHWGLTNLWALAMERWYIRWYGRKDLGTGILRNRTNGGDGSDGRIPTEYERRIKSESQVGKSVPWREKEVSVFGVIYKSIVEATSATGLNWNQIQNIKKFGYPERRKRVKSPDGTIFLNQSDAARIYKVSGVTIGSWCKNKVHGWSFVEFDNKSET